MNHNNLLTSIFLLFIIPISIWNCSKNKVQPFDPPKQFYFFNSNIELELLKETKLPGEVIATVKKREKLEVLSHHEIYVDQYRRDIFFEVICPARVKDKCKSDKAYIRGDNRRTMEFVTRDVQEGQSFDPVQTELGTIIDATEATEVNQIRAWLKFPEKEKFMNLSLTKTPIFNLALALEYPKSDDRLKVVSEILLFPEILANPNTKNSRFQFILKRYVGLKEKLTDTSGIHLPSNSSDLIKSLEEQKSNLQKNLNSDFTSRSNTYKGLVAQFNKFKNHYLVPETLFQLTAKNGAYSAKGLPFLYFSLSDSSNTAMEIIKKNQPNLESDAVVANGKLEFKGKDGVFLQISQVDTNGNLGSDESLEILSITAEEAGGSIGFRLKLSNGELILTPLVTTDFLLTSGPGFQEILSKMPKDYKEIFKSSEYERAVVLIAAKFGEGGYNEEKGKMVYKLSTFERYWMVYEILRMHPNIKREKDSNGSFVNDHGYAPNGACYESIQWRQPKGEFIISGIYAGCGGGTGNSSRVEEWCFTEKGSEDLVITFAPSELKSEKPKVQMEFENVKGDLCQFINILVLESNSNL